MKEGKTPKEYKVISGSTVFVLKKLTRGEMNYYIYNRISIFDTR